MASTGTIPRAAQPEPDSAPEARSPARPLAWRRPLAHLEPPAALLLAFAVFAAIHAATPHIVGVDGYYHIKVAALIREHGLRLQFPWLRFTILDEAGYTDHHFLFHVLQAPFTLLHPAAGPGAALSGETGQPLSTSPGEALRLAAKAAAVAFATLGFWGIYLVMRRSGVRWPLAWLTLMLAVASLFLWRHAMARPQSLALLLFVVVLWVIFERRLRWLVPLGVVSAWLFDGFVLTLLIPPAAAAARLLLERTLDWRPTALLALGTLLGLLLHPYFPNNVIFAWLHLTPKLGLGPQEAVPIGAEWMRFSSTGFARRVGPSLAVLSAGLVPTLVRLWRQEKPDYRALTLTFLAIAFLAFVVRTQRIIEYFPAFAVLAAAFSWSFNELPRPPAVQTYLRRWGPLLVGLAALGLAWGLVESVRQARRDAASPPANAQYDAYRDGALWLAANSPPGSLVFNVDWDDFPQLFFWNSHNVYVVGLDPTYFSLHDLDRYRLWRDIRAGAVPNPSTALRERFGASYAFADTSHARFLAAAAQDPGLEEVFRSERAVVFRVRPG
jgi:hypothetical protein